MSDLLRLADGLASRQVRRQTFAPAPAEAEPEPTAPEPPMCAVIGCKRPQRSLGYCASHYQKRRVMEAMGRVHPEWVPGAAPNSIPDVILPRRRRAEREEAATLPAEEVRPSDAPRVWVRKKAQGPVAPTANGEAAAASPVPDEAASNILPTPRRTEHELVASTVERWANEFRARKQPN